MKLLKNKIKSSVLVIVLIVIGIASAVLLFLSYRIVNETEQLSLEKTSAQAEQIAKTGIERVIQNITDVGGTANNIISDNLNDKGFAVLSLVDMGICTDDLDMSRTQDIPYCSSESKIVAYPSFIIVDYNLKNDETLEVNLLDDSSRVGPTPLGLPPVADDIPDLALIFKKNIDATFVVTAFDSNYKLKGKCTIKVSPGISIGQANLDCKEVSTASADAIDKALVKLSSEDAVIRISSLGVSIYRIKALTPNAPDGNVFVTITGIKEDKQLVKLPSIQEYYLRAAVYTGTGDKATYYQYNTVVMAHSMVPEVFDWVLFNGGKNAIDK